MVYDTNGRSTRSTTAVSSQPRSDASTSSPWTSCRMGRRIHGNESRYSANRARSKPYYRRTATKPRSTHTSDRKRASDESIRNDIHDLERFMTDLRLPFLSPSTCKMSLTEQLELLKWRVHVRPRCYASYAWHKAVHSTEHLSKVYDRPDGVNLSAIPSVMCEEPVRGQFNELQTSCRRGLLFLSPSWNGLTDMRWDGDIKHRMSLENGQYMSDSGTDDSDSSRVPSSANFVDPPVPEATLITRTRYARSVRARSCGEFLKVARPSEFKSIWERPPEWRRAAFDRDHIAVFETNQSSRNTDLWPQNSGARILAYLEMPQEEYPFLGEPDWPVDVGVLIGTMVCTDEFPLRRRMPNHWPGILQVGHPSTPNYSCRALGSVIGWSDDLAPVLFAAHDEGKNVQEALEILASTFHQTMILFILYYLDTRAAWNDSLPEWMVLFGVTYSSERQGLAIHAYHPIFDSPEEADEPRTSGSWGAVSTNIARSLDNIWTCAPWHRERLLMTLARIQGHCSDVLRRLRAWRGYSRLWAQFNVPR